MAGRPAQNSLLGAVFFETDYEVAKCERFEPRIGMDNDVRRNRVGQSPTFWPNVIGSGYAIDNHPSRIATSQRINDRPRFRMG